MGRKIVFDMLIVATMQQAVAAPVTLVMESWRGDDKALWEGVLLPAFNRRYPDIQIRFLPTVRTEYDTLLPERLANGTAGDLITCRPFDVSLNLYKKGYLEKLNGLQGLRNFPDSAKVAWQTDDGRDTFCVPIASVIHGFFYNRKLFGELGLTPPVTEAEFFKTLEKIKASGKYVPIALGTADQWESTQIVFTGIGPNYWGGEAGRRDLIRGRKKFTDPEFIGVWKTMARWAPYLVKGYQMQTYADSQNLFLSGRAAIYPAGSWDIAFFHQNNKLDFAAFPPPVKQVNGGRCFISDHPDIGMGINAKSRHKEQAQKFLDWLTTKEFADLYTNTATGFFSLSDHIITVKDPVAKQMFGWRRPCDTTIRLNAQIMNRGTPSMENELWNVNALVMNGKLAPKEAAERIQADWVRKAGVE